MATEGNHLGVKSLNHDAHGVGRSRAVLHIWANRLAMHSIRYVEDRRVEGRVGYSGRRQPIPEDVPLCISHSSSTIIQYGGQSIAE